MTKARTKDRKKPGKKAEKKRRVRKTPRPRRPPDERAALLSDLGRRLTGLGKTRIDEIEETYDAAYAEAQRQVDRTRARHGDSGPIAGSLRRRFHLATEALKSAFALDAIAESQSVADLQLAITAELAGVTDEDGAVSAQRAIGPAFAAWSQNARTRDRARKSRLSDLLAARGLAAPKTRDTLRAMLAEAERAVAIVRADEKRFRSEAEAQRALVAEWSSKARLARNIGEEDLAAEADARVAEHERQAREAERELTIQKAAIEKLDDQLRELRRSVG